MELGNLTKGFNFTNDLIQDAYNFLEYHNCIDTLEHTQRVANMSKKLAAQFDADEQTALTAGAFHDISAVIPNEERLKFAEDFQIDILPEERKLPLLLHQKISRLVTKEIFKIEDEAILDAISCHTTLRAKASKLDMIVFIADKLEWDQIDIPPFMNSVKAGLNVSLQQGVHEYISYLIKSDIKVVHPWLADAYKDLNSTGDGSWLNN